MINGISMAKKNILVLEPYYGGSHRSFLNGLKNHLPYTFHSLTLPARKWKWRMRFSAPYFAGLLPERAEYDAVLCSTFVDVAALKGLGPSWLSDIPVLTYFHENQFAYPVQVADERDLHFALTNLTSALASDKLAFNSRYNLESFLTGCGEISKKASDMKLNLQSRLREKSQVLFPALDFRDIDRLASPVSREEKVPIIIWNHRWEHDKNPELFFRTLYTLVDKGIQFQLVVLGQSFDRQPEIFQQARERLSSHILHFGFVDDRSSYLQWLHKGTVVISTANHEFYGISVIEAVRAGCRPILPKKLSYPELFPDTFLYEENFFLQYLEKTLYQKRLGVEEGGKLTEKFSWASLKDAYRSWFFA